MRAAHLSGFVLCWLLAAACFVCRAEQLADDPDAPSIHLLPLAKSFSGVLDVDSNPAGAQVTTSLGSGCRTPCSLEVTAEGPFTLTFTHDGYTPASIEVKIQHARMGVSGRQFTPNPAFAELAPVPPPERPRVVPKKPVAAAQPPQAAPKKPIAVRQPASTPPSKPVPAAPSTEPASFASRWPEASQGLQPAPSTPRTPAAAEPGTDTPPAQSVWPDAVPPGGSVSMGNRTVPATRATSNIVLGTPAQKQPTNTESGNTQ
jgi:PEGA domain